MIRAGVTIGDAHVGLNGKGPVFGPAMVRAYEIETHEAVHPRIVVDRSAYETFLTDTRLHKQGHTAKMEARYVDKLLRVDVDGTRFVDYLAGSEFRVRPSRRISRLSQQPCQAGPRQARGDHGQKNA